LSKDDFEIREGLTRILQQVHRIGIQTKPLLYWVVKIRWELLFPTQRALAMNLWKF